MLRERVRRLAAAGRPPARLLSKPARLVALLATVALALAIVPAALAAGPPLRTGLVLAGAGPGGVDFERASAAGATFVRVTLNWAAVASRTPAAPEDPGDPAYDWAAFDAEIALAAAYGLEPIATVMWAPPWAEGESSTGPPGTRRPDPIELARFARAAAARYDGVRLWQVWNEPNHHYFFNPQFVDGSLAAAAWYRSMVNRFADAVRGANPANVVVAGGTAPFGQWNHAAPLRFMRELLCMSPPPHRPVCDARVEFDVWAHHPYTSGPPTRRAFGREDVSLGDLPEMRRLLRAAVSSGRVVSSRNVQFWVTEFSWDTDPPDRYGVPVRLHARWVSEALYRMWRSGVSAVAWFLVTDGPTPGLYQSGLHFADGRRKPAFQAFRFPFVALVQSRRVLVWGRTPPGQAGAVVVEHRQAGPWRPVARIATDANGLFVRRLRAPRRGSLRARAVAGSELSRPFSLTRPRTCFVNAFGNVPPPALLRPIC